MRGIVRLSVLVMLPMLALPASAAGAIIYSQNPTYPGTFNAFVSQAPQTGNPISLTFDSFRLATTRTIIGVQWQGMYVNTASPGGNPPGANATAFNVSFLADNGGQPGGSLQGIQYPIGQVSETFIGTGLFDFGLGPILVPVFNFSVLLAQPFTAQANTTYWLGIQEVSPTGVPQPMWAWTSGFGPDNSSIQDVYPPAPGSGRYVRPGDRAFALDAALGAAAPGPIPEPSSLALLGLGVLGLLARARRGRSR